MSLINIQKIKSARFRSKYTYLGKEHQAHVYDKITRIEVGTYWSSEKPISQGDPSVENPSLGIPEHSFSLSFLLLHGGGAGGIFLLEKNA